MSKKEQLTEIEVDLQDKIINVFTGTYIYTCNISY
jgi:hypothetical protein